MCGKRSCIERITRVSTEPSPTPASNTRTAGGRGWMLPSSSATRLATTHFSEQVLTNSRYFCRLSKKRKLRCGSSEPGACVIGTGPSARQRRAQRRRALDHQRARQRRLALMARHEAADAVERLGGDAPAVAQAAGELAVVHGAAAEGRFGKAALAAEIGDFLQDGVVHGRVPRWLVRRGALAQANQVDTFRSTTKGPTKLVGRACGCEILLVVRPDAMRGAWLIQYWASAHQQLRCGQEWAACRSRSIGFRRIANSRIWRRTAVSTSCEREPCAARVAHPTRGHPSFVQDRASFSATRESPRCRASRPISATCSSSIR